MAAMAKTLWHVTMSLDGFVAGPDNDMQWMFGGGFSVDPDVVDKWLDSVGALLIGHRTFFLEDGAAGEVWAPYGGRWDGPIFVFTREDSSSAVVAAPAVVPPVAPAVVPPGFVFLNGSISEVLEIAKAAAGDKYVSILGPATAKKVLDAGLLDEILVHVAPVLLGDGIRMFDHPGGVNVRLEMLGGEPEVTNMWLRVWEDLKP